MSADFVHLHVHTHYSLLDGACTPEGLAETARAMNMRSVAITDHGFLGGAMDFYRTMKRAEINPIIGCEAYISPTTRFDRNPDVPNIRGFHLVLLAENNLGYSNLCRMVSESWRHGIYYKPRMDKDLLRDHHQGIIALSACIGGEIPYFLLKNDQAAARRALEEYREIFGTENFFLELMNHGLEDEIRVNRELISLAWEYGLKCVCTNDVHYLKKEHADAHEIMLCVQTNSLLSDPGHFHFSGPEYYFKSPEEMALRFGEVPETLHQTLEIAERCRLDFQFVPEVSHYPVYRLSDGTEPGTAELRKICLENIPFRYGFNPASPPLDEASQNILKRLEYELSIIERTGFVSYFLVVGDFIRYAREQNIPVGPGRGSGAGSLAAYLARITDVDPLRYGLLFERFLNPERISPPDFDIDFCEKRRSEVIDYVRKKYGEDNVAQICTYSQLKARAVVKDVARVLGYDFSFGNRLTRAIPPDLNITLAEAERSSPELQRMLQRDPRTKKVFQYARVLEGLNRQLGIHAAGVIIGDRRLEELLPLARGVNGEIITEFPAGPCEQLGLLKMDFLGLRTLTIIQRAVELIEEQHGVGWDPGAFPLDDAETFAMLRRGDTTAVFQLESDGMRKLCRNFGVEKFEHIIALLAIYRPGPMQFIPDFIRRKRGEEPIVYDHLKMEPILRETYGIMLYQEQIMQVVQELAGFTLGGADILRRAIGKKNEDVLAAQKSRFLIGCAEVNGIPAEAAERIWEKIRTFAGYGFNKSHSAAYALVSYRTAYLKAHYPVEFMASVLTGELSNADKIAFLIQECRGMGIQVLAPDVNSSGQSFSVDNGRIRFGLGAIKGLGEVAAAKILASRREGGAFRSFPDFAERCGTELTSRMIDCLIRSGALDAFSLRRSQLAAIAAPVMKFSSARAKDRAGGQGSLFDLLEADDASRAGLDSVPVPDIPEFRREELLASEKELLGFYLSGHPLERYAGVIAAFSSISIRQLAELPEQTPVRLVGMVGAFVLKHPRGGGKRFGILRLEDLESAVECTLYEDVLNAAESAGVRWQAGFPVLVEARVIAAGGREEARLRAERIFALPDAVSYFSGTLFITVSAASATTEKIQLLIADCILHPGPTRLEINFADSGKTVEICPEARMITVNPTLLETVERLFGSDSWRLIAKPFLPKRAKTPFPRSVSSSSKKSSRAD